MRVGSQRHDPTALYPRGKPGTYCIGGGVGPRSGLDRCGKFAHHRKWIVGLFISKRAAIPSYPGPFYNYSRNNYYIILYYIILYYIILYYIISYYIILYYVVLCCVVLCCVVLYYIILYYPLQPLALRCNSMQNIILIYRFHPEYLLLR